MRQHKKNAKLRWAASILAGSLIGYTLSAQESPSVPKAPPVVNASAAPAPKDNKEIQLVAQAEQPPADTTSLPSIQSIAESILGSQSVPAPALAAQTNPTALSTEQRPLYTPLSDIVTGGEAVTRAATDVGDLLGKSLGGLGVEIQRRTPIINDPRVRGYQGGQVISTADGAYFFPARPDLDTIVSRIDSTLVDNVVVIKGPYTVRRGPGFSFIDIETLGTPRYDCFEGHGSTSVTYKTNGAGWSGRQAVWGGGPDWGFRVGWDVLASGDYVTGAGVTEPSSYNMQNLDFALGADFTENLSAEFKYFRTMQRDVLFPGALTDLNSLITDAFTTRVVLKEADFFRSSLDMWYNHTSFDGDNLRGSKRAFLPFLNDLGAGAPLPPNGILLPPGSGLTLNLVTSGDNNSWGFRNATTFGRDKAFQITGGWDFRYTSQALNEFDTFFLQTVPGTPGQVTYNFPIPRSRQIDPGLFLDTSVPVGERLNLKAGARVDFVDTAIQQPVNIAQPPLPFPNVVSNAINADTLLALTDLGPNALAERHFNVFSGFATGDFKLTEEVSVLAAYGHSELPPSLVQLYGDGPFLTLLQNGGTFVVGGNPSLLTAVLNQGDLGIKADYEKFRAGLYGYYAWIHDYVTFVRLASISVPGLPGYRFINTPQATLAGFEAYTDFDLCDWLTPFATLVYCDGRDLHAHEPLPGIYPLDGRAGFRIHDPAKRSRWAVEFSARMVAGQDQVATSLLEVPTSGFTIFNIRSYWQVRDNLLFTAGFENLGNRNYQEHFDARFNAVTFNNAVFQPGFNFYAGFRWNY
jgi:outer membrane receptor protein involved in Fe transport